LIAELHVIGGHGLGDRAGCRARLEESANYFLASADFYDGPIFQGVQVYSKGFFNGAGKVFGHKRYVQESAALLFYQA
jgi:hypothetical protein